MMGKVILHLSDLHFGVERSDITGLDQRKSVLSNLIECIKSQPSDWLPDIICISGDIAYAGKDADYEAAASWLTMLLESTDLTPSDLVICAGNHDVDRNTVRGVFYPPDSRTADETLNLPVPDHIQKRFEALTNFCESFGMPSMQLHGDESYLIGTRTVHGIRFVVLNSSWFCLGGNDKGNLWAGLPHVRALESDGVLSLDKTNNTPPCIAVIHHPRDWLHESEHTAYANSNRPNTIDYLAKRCDVILTGHTHGFVRDPDKIAASAWHITAGATYDNATHFNNFSLMKIEPSGFTLRRFEFDPRASDQPWTAKGHAKFYPFNNTDPTRPPTEPLHETSITKAEILMRSCEYAERERDKKSRAIKRIGDLPEIIDRQVTIFLQQEHYYVEAGGGMKPYHREVREPLTTAINRNARTLLLAELGSGKSTLAAQLVSELCQQAQILSFFIPAGRLKGYTFNTVGETLDTLTTFIKNQIVVGHTDFDLNNFLLAHSEITLVVDGLDELDQHNARNLLDRLSDMVHQWANLRVVATGRPVEMVGFDYTQWQLLNLSALLEDEQYSLLYNESISAGLTPEEAEQNAQERLTILKKRQELAAVATTPLSLRLFYPHLSAESTTVIHSLGMLLFDLLTERLGGWTTRTARNAVDSEFENSFPSISSRFYLLGIAANEINKATDGRVSRSILEVTFQEEFEGRNNAERLASETVSFLLRHILIQENGEVSFPVQPLFECAMAAYHFSCLQNGTSDDICGSIQWRVVSFIACLANRSNRLSRLNNWVTTYLNDLVINQKNITAAAVIVVESGNSELAFHTLEYIQQLGFRPIHLFFDDRAYSAECIAKTIIMSGDNGIKWFYQQYLDPTKPASDLTIELAGLIFTYWTRFLTEKPSSEIADLLRQLAKPHLTFEYYTNRGILAPLSLLLPELFSPNQRARLYIDLMWRGPLRTQAKDALLWHASIGDKEEVSEELVQAARIGYESSGIAAAMWMKLNSNIVPCLDIIRALAKGGFGKRAEKQVAVAWFQWAELQDQSKVRGLLHSWLTSEDSELSCVAGCILYQMGERNWVSIAPAISRGLHDGGKVVLGEVILENLIEDGGDKALSWLVRQFNGNASDFSLPHSSHWRVFLKQLSKLIEPRPKWLCHAVSALNDYILSRYPDIRQAIGDLLKQENSPYLDELRKQLHHIDPIIRKRTAGILICVFPESESEAAEIALNADYESGVLNFETFFQRLRLGPSVLTHLHNKWQSWGDKARIFSLLLLYRNGIQLNDLEWGILVRGILERHPFIEERDPTMASTYRPILAHDRALPILLQALSNNSGQSLSRAATALLNYHASELTIDQLARCYMVSLNFSGSLHEILNQKKRAVTDNIYYEAVRRITLEFEEAKKEEPLLSLLVKSIKDPVAWKDIAWNAFFTSDNFGSRVEHIGEWLYEIAMSDAKAQHHIADAAAQYLKDPRVIDNPKYVSNARWLAVLGHCFGTVSTETLKKYVTHNFDRALSICIAARLDEQLVETEIKETPNGISSRSLTVQELTELINQVLMTSEEFHPDFFNLLELFFVVPEEIPAKTLSEFSRRGMWGGWFIILLQFCSNKSLDVHLLASLTTSWYPNRSSDREALIRRMVKSRQLVYRYVCHVENTREIFVKELRQQGSMDWTSEGARYLLLLSCKAELSESEINVMLDSVASSEFSFDTIEFMTLFIGWLINEGDKKVMIVKEGLQRGIRTLINHKPLHKNDALQRLLFPAAAWVFGDSPDQISVNLFLLGLHKVLVGEQKSIGEYTLDSMYNILAPLWSKIPETALQKIFETGVTSHLPDVRALCALLQVIAKA